MGLISWIKNKYYNYQLSKADKLVDKENLIEAKSIYTKILGKQDDAMVHLAKMLTDHADTVQKQIEFLKEITDLSQYETNENKVEYTSELDRHILIMERNAELQFSKNRFSDAVNLQKAVLSIKNNLTNKDRYHRYSAFMYYDESNTTRDYKSGLKAAAKEFKEISSYSPDDLRRIDKELVEKYKILRSISFLLEFSDNEPWIKQEIVNHIIDILLNNDSETKDVALISDICSNEEICKETAAQIYALAISYANEGDYKKAILLDNYAYAYLLDDNDFINTRCEHALEELAPRANADEVYELLKFIERSNLNDVQKDSLTTRIAEIANLADEEKAIEICKLFDNVIVFKQIYVDKALSLCKTGKRSLVNSRELKQKIKDITTEDNYPDTLGRFVNYISDYESEFFKCALDRIIKRNDMSLLNLYWHIKPNHIFFDRLVCKENPNYSNAISYIVSNNTIFLTTEAYRDTFCQQVKSLGDYNNTISVSEDLLKDNCDVSLFYETTVLEVIKGKDSKEALTLVNHALSILASEKFTSEKKRLIRNFIALQDFELAERETKTLENIDSECWTIYAEILFAKSETESGNDRKIPMFYAILDLCKEHQLYTSFESKEKQVLTTISEFSLEYYNAGNYKKAEELCESISYKQEYWLSLFINLCNLQLESINALSQKIKHIEDCIEIINEKVDKHIAIDHEEYNSLWIELSNLYITKSESQPKDKAIESLVLVRTNLREFCNTQSIKQEDDDLTKLIVKIKWNYALELEKEYAFQKAIEMYTCTVQENVSSYQKRAVMRANICHLKETSIDDNVEHSILENLEEKSYIALREDLAYRYVCFLLKSIRPSEAESLIRKYLPQETELLDVCQNIYVKECEHKLEEFNEKLKQIQQNEMSIEEAKTFLKEVDNYKEEISKHLTDTSSKFSKYKIQIRAYILKCMFNGELYTDALKTLKTLHPNYIENETAFRNLAVASIGIIESDCNDAGMLRTAIAIALSAIYSDNLFVNSLEHTSWDDQFTFTLNSSLGKSVDDDYEILPDNVNFDESIDNQNISIKDVQNNLIIRIETAIRDIHAELEEWYRFEKDSIEKILDLNMDLNFIIATPTLCKELQEVSTSIKEALDYEYNQEYGNQEDVLSVGVLYGFTDGNYFTYQQASKDLNICKECLTNRHSVNDLNYSFTDVRVNRIKEFDGLYSKLKATCTDSIHNAINSKMDCRLFLNTFRPICEKLEDLKISLLCANYIDTEIRAKIINKSLNIREGVDFLISAYKLAPSNCQVKEDLKGSLTILARASEVEGGIENKQALLKAQRELNGEFDSDIKEGRIQGALENIGPKLKDKTLKLRDALEKIVDIYKIDKSNKEVTDILKQLLQALIIQAEQKDDYNDRNTITKVERELGVKFAPFIKGAKIQAKLNNIVAKVNEDKMDLKTALKKVYALYEEYPNNSKICENLATLCTMCIPVYIIKGRRGKSEVKSVLDSLVNNRSVAFKSMSSKFRKEYNDIMSNIPQESRNILLMGFDINNINVTLSDSGKALKEGLDYYSELGGLTAFDRLVF